jgi:uncharacterized protein (DUF58 family)
LIPEFHYRVRWRSHRAHPGHHRSNQVGGGDEFAGHAPLVAYPDPRNIDVHATLHDPFGQLMVRLFRQRSSLPVYVIADLSASMGFGSPRRKLDTVADFTAAAAYSAYRTGDPFGFFGGDEALRWDLHLPLRWYKGVSPEFRRKLATSEPLGASAAALRQIAPLLGRQRSLVFLVSDFHFSPDDTAALLDALIHHDVVPIVVWRDEEYTQLPTWGWINLQDPETGECRRMFMRPGVRDDFQRRFAKRREELGTLCQCYGRKPFFIAKELDADRLSEYFLTGS